MLNESLKGRKYDYLEKYIGHLKPQTRLNNI
jgi:hypothetical protein